jgi:hypothetical protein
MKLLLLLTGVFLFTSCAVSELGKKSKKISEELISAFNHEDIVTSVGVGTDEEDNRVSIAFCRYAMANKCYPELENLATQVKAHVLAQNPDVKKMYLIQVQFTGEEDADELQNVVTFQFRNLNSAD